MWMRCRVCGCVAGYVDVVQSLGMWCRVCGADYVDAVQSLWMLCGVGGYGAGYVGVVLERRV